ncbi:MAG: hypothetical protein IPL65_11670 [Lewinellaceae bacterium]|nr:hypothetical protein [Lewinellaceae bacterium]
MGKRLLSIVLTVALMAATGVASAQVRGTVAADTLGKLRIESSETGEAFLKGGRELRKLSGSVRLRQENTVIFCDTAIIDENDARLRGNVLIIQGDSVRIYADSALYYGDLRNADLFGDVVLVNREQELFTRQLHYDLVPKIASYHTSARLNNGSSQLSSQHGYYYVDQKEIFFKGDVLITDPDFTVRTDTMGFNTETKTARFLAPTLISQRGAKIYCEGGFYDLENDFAEFDVNPQYEKEGQRGKAQKMRYLGATKEYILDGDAYIEEPAKQRLSKANVIRYNSETEVLLLSGDAYYRDSTQEVNGTKIRYDSKEKRFQLLGRGSVSDPPNIIEADSLDFNDQLGNGVALGSVLWRDTSSDFSILAWRMDYNKQSDFINAFGGFGEAAESGRPLLKTLIENDTLFMSADTLTSYKIDTINNDRLLLAYRDVRIFKSNLQAVCDSLAFSTVDSIFWFYQINQLPIIWSDTSQFSADTILLALRDKKVDKIWLRKNALVINSEDDQYYNQIKGRNTTAYFKENELREMLVEGNAQALYYALDDKRAYIGLNESECSEMRLFFGDNKVEDIRFYEQPKGKFTPMKKLDKGGRKLDGFFWESARRPMRLSDILVQKTK